MKAISHTDLILNPDGSIYHLHLLPGDLADQVILVGDPGRVKQVSAHFEHIELEKSNREFVTHTGTYRGRRMSVISTGIGTDNIDIVLNELDALVNVDLKKRTVKPGHRCLNLVRIGTSGALHADITPGQSILTRIAGGFDGLFHFYKDPGNLNMKKLVHLFMKHTDWKNSPAEPYFIKGSEKLFAQLSEAGIASGITLSTPGFYAPQLRSIRLSPANPELLSKMETFSYEGMRINNFEMESSALYGLSSLLGHEAITICVAIANRISLEFLENYHDTVDGVIAMVLDKLTRDD